MALVAVRPAIASPVAAVVPDACRGEITLRHVTFRYPGARPAVPAVDDVSLTIPYPEKAYRVR